MKRMFILLLLAVVPSVRAAVLPASTPVTTNNDDSCDIGVYPAASLLLPYFEVEVTAPAETARTTLFTIVNTTRVPQIANVTIWTDWAYPVSTFDIFLTGYDVQAINLYDILVRGVVAPPNNTSNATTPGSRSLANSANPNFLASAQTSCAPSALGGGIIPAPLAVDVLRALTTGVNSLCGNSRIGGVHPTAVGYITIDVVATCSSKLPTDPTYYSELLFDNVLTGDYQLINPNPTTGNYASGNPLVHIRAIPEGGAASSEAAATSLPYTFYDRLTPANARRIDRRQPLPMQFAARFINGGTSAFNTDLQIWREASTSATATCADYAKNSDMLLADVVLFDERENPYGLIPPGLQDPPGLRLGLAAVRRIGSNVPIPPPGDALAGWLYLNLNNGGATTYSAASGRDFLTDTSTIAGPRQNQNWVTLTMYAEGRFSASFDATQLGNGCSPAPAGQQLQRPGSTIPPIGPAPNVTP